jgi:hypothetical protein
MQSRGKCDLISRRLNFHLANIKIWCVRERTRGGWGWERERVAAELELVRGKRLRGVVIFDTSEEGFGPHMQLFPL